MDLKSTKIGFFGAGNIAKAIGGGLIKANIVKPGNVTVSAPSDRSFAEWKALGAKTTHDNNELIKNSDIIFLCMKPYQFEKAIDELVPLKESSKLFVSTLSGVTLETLALKLKKFESARIVRSMPNTPLLVSAGCTVITPDWSASEKDVKTIKEIFQSVGKCEIIPEHLISPAVGVAGSSPAFIYVVIEAMADAGVKGGLPRDQAQTFAAQAVMGAAKMVLESGKHPGELKDAVCSPGGTTICGIHALEKAGLRAAMMAAVEAATLKSEEMTKMYK